ncbi:MAG: response regulator transcription factor [Acidobacteria bacterium]|nr:response regulator transcription factor [Acidobacteriota bacterium]
MERTRVLVANRPRLMRELVLATIAEQPDIEIIGEIRNDAELPHIVVESQPDILIIALDISEERPAICDQLLSLRPQMKIVALAPERNRGILFWAVVGIQEAHIESSEQGILRALRGKGQLIQH